MRLQLLTCLLSLGCLLGDGRPSEGDIRLTGYRHSPRAGRLEIYEDQKWMTVCNHDFNLAAAHVACRQLGFGPAMDVSNLHKTEEIEKHNRYGYSTEPGTANLTVFCYGYEKNILNCAGYLENNCSNYEVVEISCSNFTKQAQPGDVRLVDSGISEGNSRSEGTLEIYINGEWKKPCSKGFDSNAAVAVCNQLGFADLETFELIDGDEVDPAFFEDCYLGIPCVGQCLSLAGEACLNTRHIRLTCSYPDVQLISNLGNETCLLADSAPSEGSLRLLEDNTLEIYSNGAWGTICGRSEHFSVEVAHVACRQLGFIGVDSVHLSTGKNGVTMVYNHINCRGGEETLSKCQLIRNVTTSCKPVDTVGLTCINNYEKYSYGSVRLFGTSGGSGSLAVYDGTTFKAVCDANFTMTEANVACRQLGYPRATGFTTRSYFDHELDIFVTSVKCTGKESSLLECQYDKRPKSQCGPYNHIGLYCDADPEIQTIGNSKQIDLVDKNDDETGGKPVVKIGQDWYYICSDGFDFNSAQVACRQMQFESAVVEGFSKTSLSSQSDLTGFYILLCHGFENSLSECRHLPSHPSACPDIVNIECNPKSDSDPVEGTLRLVNIDDTNYRGLEMYRFGRWGQICGSVFRKTEANIACKELGYLEAEDFKSVTYKAGSPMYNIRNIDCSGSETKLKDCPNDVSTESCSGNVIRIHCRAPTVIPTTDTPIFIKPKTEQTFATSVPADTPVGLIVGVVLGILVLIFLAVLLVVAIILAKRYLKRRRRDKEESDWVPGTGGDEDINFNNPRYEDPSKVATLGKKEPSPPPVYSYA